MSGEEGKTVRRCDKCEFFLTRTDLAGERYGAGYCVRFPPRFQLGDTLNDGFPNVTRTTWCGEFRASQTGGGAL